MVILVETACAAVVVVMVTLVSVVELDMAAIGSDAVVELDAGEPVVDDCVVRERAVDDPEDPPRAAKISVCAPSMKP